MRFVLWEGDRNRSELDHYVTLSNRYFDKKSAEISRLVVHPDYRGGDIFMHLMRNVVREACEAKVDFVLVDCRSFLLKVYKRLGAQDTGLTIEIPLYPGEKMHVIYFEAGKSQNWIYGKFTYWVKVLLPLYRDLIDEKVVQPNPIFRCKIIVGRVTEKLMNLVDSAKWRFQKNHR